MCDESPWDFIRRCFTKEGASFVFAPAKGSSPDHPQHAIILFNESQQLDENEAGEVRFHWVDGTEEKDAITSWHARRTLQCGSVTRRTWDHNSGSLSTTTEELQSDQGSFGNALASTIEEYRHETPLEHDDPGVFEKKTETHAQVREQRTKTFAGNGSVRDFRAGTTFTLTQHPVHDQDPVQSREFVLMRVELDAENNLPKGLEDGLKGILKGHGATGTEKPGLVYQNHFECIRMGIPLLPDEVPFAPFGYLTATVVGPGDQAVHTDELGRIKIRLHVTREDDHAEAGASGTDKDSFWVRFVQPWSSQGMGGNLLPRVGDEVLVSSLNNDPDKLVILGVLPGGTRKPGRFSEASELPGDRAISGLRSREHGGTMGNQMLMDDTPGEVRAHFSSDHAASELNLGFITQPRAGGVAQARGEGAELRTDGTASIRAAKGLLLTAAAQIRAGGPQLAREELAQLFEAFGSLTDSLGNYAGQHQGLPPKTDPEKALQGHLKDWETGTNTKPKTQRPGEGQRLIALSAPDGLVAATPKTAVVYAGENLDLAAQQYAHITVGQQLVVNAGMGLSLFSHKGGFKAIAHQDDMDIQAQHGDIVMTAAKNVKIFASENEILIAASKKLTLMCGGRNRPGADSTETGRRGPGEVHLGAQALHPGDPWAGGHRREIPPDKALG
jgi:type VI secretion system secreted protein VgrG